MSNHIDVDVHREVSTIPTVQECEFHKCFAKRFLIKICLFLHDIKLHNVLMTSLHPPTPYLLPKDRSILLLFRDLDF